MKQSEPKYYLSKCDRIAGTNYKDILSEARKIYASYTKRTKRNPYARSKYFNGQKIFLNVFWTHIMQKRINERSKRLKLYSAALDLIENTRFAPTSKPNPNDSSEILHRFYGTSKDGIRFYVQIKQDLKTGNRYFMSIIVPK
ncbi:MAG: hypothetical protein FWF33_07130 [Clostridiales bacterium]|nr:hypothetical protein [Clostridiales bacterium]